MAKEPNPDPRRKKKPIHGFGIVGPKKRGTRKYYTPQGFRRVSNRARALVSKRLMAIVRKMRERRVALADAKQEIMAAMFAGEKPLPGSGAKVSALELASLSMELDYSRQALYFMHVFPGFIPFPKSVLTRTIFLLERTEQLKRMNFDNDLKDFVQNPDFQPVFRNVIRGFRRDAAFRYIEAIASANIRNLYRSIQETTNTIETYYNRVKTGRFEIQDASWNYVTRVVDILRRQEAIGRNREKYFSYVHARIRRRKDLPRNFLIIWTSFAVRNAENMKKLSEERGRWENWLDELERQRKAPGKQ